MVNKVDDWKELLAPEARSTLAKILNSTKRHKGAYINADDVKIAQLWSALIELSNKMDEIQKIQVRLEEPFKAIVEVGEKEKRKAIESIVRGIVRPTDENTEDAAQDLVDSLMKF